MPYSCKDFSCAIRSMQDMGTSTQQVIASAVGQWFAAQLQLLGQADAAGGCGVRRRRSSFMTMAPVTTPVSRLSSQATCRGSSPASRASCSNSTKARSPLGCLSNLSLTLRMGVGKSHSTNGAPWRNAPASSPAPADSARDRRPTGSDQTVADVRRWFAGHAQCVIGQRSVGSTRLYRQSRPVRYSGCNPHEPDRCWKRAGFLQDNHQRGANGT